MTTDYTAIDDVLRLGLDQLDAANAYIRSTDIKPTLTENNICREYTHTGTITDAAIKSISHWLAYTKTEQYGWQVLKLNEDISPPIGRQIHRT